MLKEVIGKVEKHEEQVCSRRNYLKVDNVPAETTRSNILYMGLYGSTTRG